MYFENREQAGKMLAERLANKYRYEDCIVIALSDGGVVVGEQIAKALHCVLTFLLIEEFDVPGEGVSFGGVSQNGRFTYNGMLSVGEVEEYTNEYHGFLEEQKREAFQKINRLLGDGGFIEPDMIRDRVVILVSDGFDSGASFDVAVDFLKPIRTKKIVAATPISTVSAVDKLHILSDEIHVLDVKDNFLGVNHYYERNNVPSHEETIAKINKIILNWR